MKEEKTINPVFVAEFKDQKAELEAAVKSAAQAYSKVKTEWDRLGLPEISDIANLFNVSQNPRGAVRAALLARLPDNINGVKLSREKMDDLIDMPDMQRLFEASNGIQQTTFIRNSRTKDFDFYAIQDGQVIINKGRYDAHMKALEIWATTPEEIERYDVLKALADSVNAVIKQFPRAYDQVDIPGLRRYVNGYKPDYKFVKKEKYAQGQAIKPQIMGAYKGTRPAAGSMYQNSIH